MQEFAQSHPTLYIIALFLAYFGGGCTALAVIAQYVYLQDRKRGTEHECHIHPRRMELDADRDAIAEAVGVIH